jgi:signal transduction histidine kinase
MRDEARDPAAAALAALTHELRTPVAVLMGYLELMETSLFGQVDERGRQAIARMQRASEELHRMIDGIQLLAQSTAADAVAALEREEVELAPLLRAASQRAAEVARERGTGWHAAPPDLLPVLLTDRERLATAVEFALVAAVRASPRRALTMTVAGGTGVTRVRVEGTLLPAGPVARFFGDGAAPLEGALLRIAVAARQLELLGGELRLEPGAQPDAGTCLELRLPGGD